jgi:hypothetical protein
MSRSTRVFLEFVAIVSMLVGVALIVNGGRQAQVHAQDEPKTPVKADTPKADSPKESSKYAPDDSESKDLRIDQLSAQLAQAAFSNKSQTLPEFGQFQASLAVLNGECQKIIAKHKWPAGTVCDVQQVPIRFCSALPCSVPTLTPATVPAK